MFCIGQTAWHVGERLEICTERDQFAVDDGVLLRESGDLEIGARHQHLRLDGIAQKLAAPLQVRPRARDLTGQTESPCEVRCF